MQSVRSRLKKRKIVPVCLALCAIVATIIIGYFATYSYVREDLEPTKYDVFPYDFTFGVKNGTLQGFGKRISLSLILDSPKDGHFWYIIPIEDYGELFGKEILFMGEGRLGQTVEKPRVEIHFKNSTDAKSLEPKGNVGNTYFFELEELRQSSIPSRLVITQRVEPNFDLNSARFVVWITGRLISMDEEKLIWVTSLLIPPELDLHIAPISDAELTNMEYSGDLRLITTESEPSRFVGVQFYMRQSEEFRASQRFSASLNIAVMALILTVGFSAANLVLGIAQIIKEG